ncbi:hypothetical protein P8935_23060 [Telmatobacter sp. DSM 110680]|uniref:NHL repeat-containing protein n=1 Tax=Telmatobacter sp. DSM 110680 TaxID=3036704 RepID=A0AAU7DK08_9BACT
MHRIRYSFRSCLCALFVVVGCGSNQIQTGTNNPPVTNPPDPPSSTTPSSVTEPSVYVVGSSVLVFPQTAKGATKATLEIPGAQVSVDEAGNVYVFTGSAINEYLATALNGPPIRSLSVGPGTAVSNVQDVMASSTGEIFVSSSGGVAVFSPTATGNASPSRNILGRPEPTEADIFVFSPGFIAVDGSDQLYVQNTYDSTIEVFGPTDTGYVVPARTISGPLTRVSGSGNYITGMTTDTAGNLYVLCLCGGIDGTGVGEFGVFEFDHAANGNVAPTRIFTSPEMYPFFYNNGVGVSTDGTIYVSGGTNGGIPTVFEFSPSSSGGVTNTVTLAGWTSADSSRIAVH